MRFINLLNTEIVNPKVARNNASMSSEMAEENVNGTTNTFSLLPHSNLIQHGNSLQHHGNPLQHHGNPLQHHGNPIIQKQQELNLPGAKPSQQELLEILKTKYNRGLKDLNYIGQGINGNIYNVMDDSNTKYVCKVIDFNEQLLVQLKKELGLLKTVQAHPYMNEYINPCLSVIVMKGLIISVFPVFNGVTLDNVINVFNGKSFNRTNRILLTKYIIKSILEAVYFFHKLDVCHLQINGDSILIELRQPSKSDIENNKYVNKNTGINNEDIHVSKEDKFIPTNGKIYKPAFSPELKPLQIKFTNFGIGCGKLTNINPNSLKNNTATNYFESCRAIDYSVDPYINNISRHTLAKINSKNSYQLSLAKKYDIWLTGMLLLKLITSPGVDLSDPARLTYSQLIDPEFDLYLNLISKYMLCPIKNRQTTKFVQEMINLGEKHDD